MNTPVLGVDFDNTIVSYDALFHRIARERGLMPPGLPASKTEIRNHLRAAGRERDWTEMQGIAYGERMAGATPFPGVREFFAECARRGIRACIISHRTKRPFLGPTCDLHEAARAWLEGHDFFSPPISLPPARVFLELTREAKLERIAREGCTAFIDDLPEFLATAGFPTGIHRLLFDPQRLHTAETAFPRMESWAELRGALLP